VPISKGEGREGKGEGIWETGGRKMEGEEGKEGGGIDIGK